MLSYDSKTKVLSLQYKVRDPDRGYSYREIGEVDLSKLSGSEQQRIVAISKLVIEFATGHDVRREQLVVRSDRSQLKVASRLARTADVLNRSTAIAGTNDTSPKENLPSTPPKPQGDVLKQV